MKKDYSKNNFINSCGINLPNIIGLYGCYLISIPIYLIFKDKISFLLISSLLESFIGLEIGGFLLNKNCTNKDIDKCKNCKCWNCNRK